MADYIDFGQATAGGRQVIEVLRDVRDAAEKLRRLTGLVNAIGRDNLENHPDFMVVSSGTPAEMSRAFNDVLLGSAQAIVAVIEAQDGAIARLARE